MLSPRSAVTIYFTHLTLNEYGSNMENGKYKSFSIDENVVILFISKRKVVTF